MTDLSYEGKDLSKRAGHQRIVWGFGAVISYLRIRCQNARRFFFATRAALLILPSLAASNRRIREVSNSAIARCLSTLKDISCVNEVGFGRQMSSLVITGRSERRMARSIMFSNSRTFPG